MGLKIWDHDVAVRQSHSQNHATKKGSTPRKEENPGDSMDQNIIHKIWWVQEYQKWMLLSEVLRAVGKRVQSLVFRRPEQRLDLGRDMFNSSGCACV